MCKHLISELETERAVNEANKAFLYKFSNNLAERELQVEHMRADHENEVQVPQAKIQDLERQLSERVEASAEPSEVDTSEEEPAEIESAEAEPTEEVNTPAFEIDPEQVDKFCQRFFASTGHADEIASMILFANALNKDQYKLNRAKVQTKTKEVVRRFLGDSKWSKVILALLPVLFFAVVFYFGKSASTAPTPTA